MTKGLFITATNTDVGKTYISALLAKTLQQQGFRSGYYKAALSGATVENGKLIPGDAAYVLSALESTQEPADAVCYTFQTPVSPHLAAQLEQTEIHFTSIQKKFVQAQQDMDFLTVEGCGGIICPISMGEEKIMQTDIIQRFGLSALLVADAGLGTINATLLTCFYAKALGISIPAILLNRFQEDNRMHRDNRKIIKKQSGLPVYTCPPGCQQLPIPFDIICNWYQPLPHE